MEVGLAGAENPEYVSLSAAKLETTPDPRGTKQNQNASRDVGLAGAENPESVSLSAAKTETTPSRIIIWSKTSPGANFGPLGEGGGGRTS